MHLLIGKLTISLTDIGQILHLLTGKLTSGLAQVGESLQLLAGKLARCLAKVTVLSATLKNTRQVRAADVADSASKLSLTRQIGLRSVEGLTVTLLRGLRLLSKDGLLCVPQSARTKLTHALATELPGLDEGIRHLRQKVLG